MFKKKLSDINVRMKEVKNKIKEHKNDRQPQNEYNKELLTKTYNEKINSVKYEAENRIDRIYKSRKFISSL